MPSLHRHLLDRFALYLAVMEDCSKFRLYEKHLFLQEKTIPRVTPSLYACEISRAEAAPVDPPPYSEKPIRLQRSGSQYKRSSQLICPSKEKSKIKLQGPCPVCVARYLKEVLRAWVESQRKPYSAITVQIDHLTSEQYDQNDIGGIPDLVEVIRIQDSGPTEAARALRKKLYVAFATRASPS